MQGVCGNEMPIGALAAVGQGRGHGPDRSYREPDGHVVTVSPELIGGTTHEFGGRPAFRGDGSGLGFAGKGGELRKENAQEDERQRVPSVDVHAC